MPDAGTPFGPIMLQAVLREPEHLVRTLKTYRGQSVWLVHRPGEEPRTIKCWALTPWLLFKLLLGIGQPQRQVGGAQRLRRAGLSTPPIVGGWRMRWRGRPVIEVELVWVEGRAALDMARDEALGQTDLEPLSRSIGRIVAGMSSAGLFNRDLKLANIIVGDDGAVSQIDTVGVRSSRRRVRETARMVERLGVQLPVMGTRLTRAAWVPALREALRPLSRSQRRAAVQWLQAHRRRQSA